MPDHDDKSDQFSEEETTRRAKEALRRAFKTPPTHHKPTGKKGEGTRKKDDPNARED